MPKKKTKTKTSPVTYKKAMGFDSMFASEKTNFTVGLTVLALAIYIIICFCSYFNTAADDQSLVLHPMAGDLVNSGREFHNYCGLGAMDAEHPGEQFETEQLGVRAHIQHLQAYATKEETQLNNELIDPRYNWVHKTKFIEDITGLTGTWAADPLYDQKINDILSRMDCFAFGSQ